MGRFLILISRAAKAFTGEKDQKELSSRYDAFIRPRDLSGRRQTFMLSLTDTVRSIRHGAHIVKKVH